MQIPLCNNRIEEKLDLIIRLIGELDGLKGFGSNILANIVGDIIMRR